MVTYTIGGKKGYKIQLSESNDLVVIRYASDNIDNIASLRKKSQDAMDHMVLVYSFPEANVHIYRCNSTSNQSAKQVRNQIRKSLKQKESVRFAGRVLTDVRGSFNLYTENIFIKFKDDLKVRELKAVLENYNLEIKEEAKYANNAFFVKAEEGTGAQVFGIANELLDSNLVELCHPEIIKHQKFKSIYRQQWHLKATHYDLTPVDAHIDVEGAWRHTKGKGITIAVIDDGVDIDHVEFKGVAKIVEPRDMMRSSDDPKPKQIDDQHGTACAGVACANGKKSAIGVAPDAKLMPIRLRAGLGSRFEADAFVWAADHGADVISCSWGPADGIWWEADDPNHTHFVPLPDSTRLAIDYAVRNGRNGKGCIITWAAGNGRENTMYDGYANYEKVIAIAACNDQNKRSVYSDFGTAVICSFPSNDMGDGMLKHPEPITPGIWTTDNSGESGYNRGMPSPNTRIGDAAGNYTATFGGTSSASPGAAGVVALMLAANKDLTAIQVRNIIKSSCDQIDKENANYSSDGHSIYYGYGRLNAKKAVENAILASKITAEAVVSGNRNSKMAERKASKIRSDKTYSKNFK